MKKRILGLKPFLDSKVAEYNTLEFIDEDPICIPHMFDKEQDIEIMGFIAAVLAWGQRKTIINKCRELCELMDGDPHGFVTGYTKKDLKKLDAFKHRTFNFEDLSYFLRFFKDYYSKHDSLETAFIDPANPTNMQAGLIYFREQFFALPDSPARTRKHISSPAAGSACKRINMFLRWMVRKDNAGVDFGIWHNIDASQLMIPLDLHVERVARKLELLTTKNANWQAVEELTAHLRLLHPKDPVRYDFALFGLGVAEKF